MKDKIILEIYKIINNLEYNRQEDKKKIDTLKELAKKIEDIL